MKLSPALGISLGLILFCGCGVAQVKVSGDLAAGESYAGVLVESVQVQSTEQTARAMELNQQTSRDATSVLFAEIARGGKYRPLETPADSRYLVARTSLKVTYGSRAMRAIIPGAGTGHID